MLDACPAQALDFFGARRARRQDGLIRDWAAGLGDAELTRRLRLAIRHTAEEGEPAAGQFPDFAAAGRATLAQLLAAGRSLEAEQEAVNSWRLSEDYMKKQSGGASLLGFGG